jgi:RHH-type rel operon transcriptional repressor/antitoxin RelB
MSVTLSVRLPNKMAKELNNIAKATERPKSYFVQKALETYLADQANLQLAIDRMRDVNDPVISLFEMREELGI